MIAAHRVSRGSAILATSGASRPDTGRPSMWDSHDSYDSQPYFYIFFGDSSVEVIIGLAVIAVIFDHIGGQKDGTFGAPRSSPPRLPPARGAARYISIRSISAAVSRPDLPGRHFSARSANVSARRYTFHLLTSNFRISPLRSAPTPRGQTERPWRSAVALAVEPPPRRAPIDPYQGREIRRAHARRVEPTRNSKQ